MTSTASMNTTELARHWLDAIAAEVVKISAPGQHGDSVFAATIGLGYATLALTEQLEKTQAKPGS